ncbi:MAG: ribonuclease E/G, partial [Variovorax sp.]
ILIDTDDIYEQAQQFMAHVMPEHAARVKRYRDDAALFSRFQIEHQIESAYARTVQLPSGGAIVIDHTEALVSIDVNSARAIKGGDIEETATRTNLEAADEVARQMRLRDLGGLIVIDFIDMDESKNRREVESRLRDALRQDRARVQFGSISKFGLMEMSRQRLKPALSEGSSIPCPRCGGSGHIRDTESSALQILRIIQEECLKDNTAAVHVQVPVEVASFLLNEKRPEIAKIELKQRVTVLMVPNKTFETPHYKLERLKHDDPRLDHIEASYKMAEEVEDPTSVTRRSQEPTNKQTPVIKGVLPDAPAPVAVPKPEAVRPPVVAAAPTPVAPPPPAAPVAAPAESGFFGFIKSLFGIGTPAAPPASTIEKSAIPVEAPKPVRRDGRPEGRGGRDGETRAPREGEARRGGRGEGRGGRDGERRGGRGGERTGERAGERREPREGRSSELRADAPPREPREQREPREPREGRGPREGGERRNGRGERRDGERPVTLEGNDNLPNAASLPPVADADAGAPAERSPRARGERRERGERNGEVRDRNPSDATSRELNGDAEQAAPLSAERNERPSREEREPRGERSERGEGGRRERRNGDVARSTDPVQAPAESNAEGVMARVEEDAHSEASVRREGDERRGRSRDRYGRDRRERAPRDGEATGNVMAAAEIRPVGELSAPATVSAVIEEMPASPAEASAPTAELPHSAPEALETPPARRMERAPRVAAAPSTASGVQAANGRHALPKVQAFELPLADLAQVAEGSGLHWVNSDADRVAQVRAAIAAEAKPIHVPRERPPVAVAEDGPLVLVETRRDLAATVLPFENKQDDIPR